MGQQSNCGSCDKPDNTKMVQCDNNQCKKWFHFQCVGVTYSQVKHSAWFCPACVNQQNQSATKNPNQPPASAATSASSSAVSSGIEVIAPTSTFDSESALSKNDDQSSSTQSISSKVGNVVATTTQSGEAIVSSCGNPIMTTAEQPTPITEAIYSLGRDNLTFSNPLSGSNGSRGNDLRNSLASGSGIMTSSVITVIPSTTTRNTINTQGISHVNTMLTYGVPYTTTTQFPHTNYSAMSFPYANTVTSGVHLTQSRPFEPHDVFKGLSLQAPKVNELPSQIPRLIDAPSEIGSERSIQRELDLLEEEKQIELKFLRRKHAIQKAASERAHSVYSEEVHGRTKSWIADQNHLVARKVHPNQVDETQPKRYVNMGERPSNLHQFNAEEFSKIPEATTRNPTHQFSHQQANVGQWEDGENYQPPTKDQLQARKTGKNELPKFNGDPTDWLIFYNSFTTSTRRCGFSNIENLDRLNVCLFGEARNEVKDKLAIPNMVPQIIETLKMLYGHPKTIFRAVINKLKSIDTITEGRFDMVVKFALSVEYACGTMASLGVSERLEDSLLLDELEAKLPPSIKLNWGMYAHNLPAINLQTFSDYLKIVAKGASRFPAHQSTSKDSNTKTRTRNTGRSENFPHCSHSNDSHSRNFSSSSRPSQTKTRCVACSKTDHPLDKCEKFLAMTHKQRWSVIFENKICGKCLGPHSFRTCSEKVKCGVDDCKSPHHELLHRSLSQPSPNNTQTRQSTVATTSEKHPPSNSVTMFKLIPVVLYGPSGSIHTHAFLDEGSSITLIEDEIADRIGLAGPTLPLCLKWTGNTTRTEQNSRRVSLEISGSNPEGKIYRLTDVRTVRHLNLPTQTLSMHQIENTEQLSGLPIQPYYEVTPRVLIGLQHYKLGLTYEVRESTTNNLMAAKTRLGWVVFGGGSSGQVNHHQLHVCQCNSDDDLHNIVKDFFALDNFGVKKPDTMIVSREDRIAYDILEKTTVRKDGRYETGLLWREENIKMPNSLPMATRRLDCLERKMSRDPELRDILIKKVQDHVRSGYCRKLSQSELALKVPRVWYLPIFAVSNPNKPGKTRLVWDAAAKANGVSLNSCLLKGPDLLSSLPEILYRFREREIAVCADIREMFLQIGIQEEDQHAQRFLWRDGDTTREPDHYVMQVCTFGASCSPCTAQWIKNKNAQEFQLTNPVAAASITDNHYVDDYLESFDSIEQASKTAKEVRDIHQHAGFQLRNWVSNSPQVLSELDEVPATIPKAKNLDMTEEPKGSKVLGMWWSPSKDDFYFSLNLARVDEEVLTGKRIPTKREVLRTLMSVFDPLGLISFFLVPVKILLQDIWKAETQWDETIMEPHYLRWLEWTKNLPEMRKLQIPRCYLQSRIPLSKELHIFVDASELAFSAVAYFRLADENGVWCVLVGAKTKVAPLRFQSIPRLELQAAILGARLAESIMNGHTYKVSQRVFWTDSSNVLSWLRCTKKRYKQFVAFRVSEILEKTKIEEWKWVPTKLNVADVATKHFNKQDPGLVKEWFSAPEFLYLDEDVWPNERGQEFSTSLEEVLPHHPHIVEAPNTLTPRPERFSKWGRLVRAQAYALRFFHRAQRLPLSKHVVISPDEYSRAEKMVLRQAQLDEYRDDIAILRRKQPIPKNSKLFKLSATLDAEGLLRIRGRIGTAPDDIDYDTKFPIVLPRSHRITHLVATSYHEKYHHQFNETVVNEMRRRFHISHLRAVVRNVKRNCQHCKVEHAKPQSPEMSELPPCRLSACKSPFSFVGIDYFGPMTTVTGRRHTKRWGVMFTCMTVRAIHLEMAHSLSTNSCIMAIERFMDRRGRPLEIWSDNGTNFVGASRELNENFLKLDQNRLQTSFQGIVWHFNPPGAPHMGGVWERMIRTVKSTMQHVLNNCVPDDEMLYSCLSGIEATVNSRPLTYLPVEPGASEALTPNHFLLGSSNGSKPLGYFSNEVTHLTKSWQTMQQIKDRFWLRWSLECLPDLTRRSKWFEKVEPIKIGDVVVIVGESQRNDWPLGIVIDVHPGRNQQVRSAVVRTTKGTYTRPASKLAVLDVGVAKQPELFARGEDVKTAEDAVKVEEQTNERDAKNATPYQMTDVRESAAIQAGTAFIHLSSDLE